jgi:Protein of unknown function (DUF3455)
MKRLLLLSTLAAMALTASVASAQPVPDRIQVPAGHAPYLQAHAIGAQVYACAATADGPKWQFVEPQAILYDDHARLIGIHFAGPTWQTRDGSQVKAARVDGVTVDPTAIPWLLLKQTSTTPGRLAATTYVQRLNTRGGLEPAASKCSTATVGDERKVLYTADYRFWRAAA